MHSPQEHEVCLVDALVSAPSPTNSSLIILFHVKQSQPFPMGFLTPLL